MAECGKLTSSDHLANPVVQAADKPELLFLLSVSVIWGVPHHLHEMVFMLLHSQCTLGHGTEVLGLLDENLLGHVLVAECLSKLIPRDVRQIGVLVTIAVPPRLCRSLPLVHSDGDTLLVIAVGEVVLRLNDPEPVISIHWVF